MCEHSSFFIIDIEDDFMRRIKSTICLHDQKLPLLGLCFIDATATCVCVCVCGRALAKLCIYDTDAMAVVLRLRRAVLRAH